MARLPNNLLNDIRDMMLVNVGGMVWITEGYK